EYGIMILCGGLAVLYHHSTDNVRLIILGAWVCLFFHLGRVVGKLERNGKVSRSLRDPITSGRKAEVPVVPVQDPPRVVVKT
ncbi:MAG: hypothetical protein OEW13_12130, partial [Nitrospira sp.]|nr:hypothetical protein [Nitrospira sp.]